MKHAILWINRESCDSAGEVLYSLIVCSTICKGSIHPDLNVWSRALLELIGFQAIKKFSTFMEPEDSLLHSQVPATFPIPEPARLTP